MNKKLLVETYSLKEIMDEGISIKKSVDRPSTNFRVVSPNGYLDFSGANTSDASFYTDRDSFFFDRTLFVKGHIRLYNYVGAYLSNIDGFIFENNQRVFSPNNLPTALNNLPADEKQSGKIHVTLNDNITYRWSGSVIVEISKSIGFG